MRFETMQPTIVAGESTMVTPQSHSHLNSGLPEYFNHTDSDENNETLYTTFSREFVEDKAVQIVFSMVYTTIFVLGLTGNTLVCFVVVRNRAMHTVTNLFITNLALSDILLCILAVPFTPLYTFTGHWAFGEILCHLVPFAQGISVYVSTLTLTSIAVDRFFVIIYPFKPRMKLTTCIGIIIAVWVVAVLITLPYCIYMFQKPLNGKYYCEEQWPVDIVGVIYGGLTVCLQFLIPFCIIAFCYIKVSLKLTDRARSKPGTKNTRREEMDRERKRRTNRMLIAMVTIFGVCWSPLNTINLTNDIFPHTGHWKYYYLTFFVSHALAMSSTCYNPFLYAWLNDNFRKEFKQVLPCYQNYSRFSGSQAAARIGWGRSERTCNGIETCQETLLPTSSVVMNTSKHTELSSLEMDGGGGVTLKGRSPWTGQKHDSVEIVLVSFPTTDDKANFVAHTNNVVHHSPLDEEYNNTQRV